VALAKSTHGDVLTGLGDRPGADVTARLLLALTALYVQRPAHTDAERRQYVELALRLIDKVDAATRVTVTAILRRHPDAPTEVFARLEDKQCAPGHAPDGMPHSPRDRHPADEERTPAPSEPAPPAPQQAPVPPELGEAFFAAPPPERRRLLSRIAPSGGRPDGPAAAEAGERIHQALDVAALQGRIGEFTRAFERLLAAPKSLCERILNDRSGEPMVVAAKATGVPIAVLQRILLLINPAVSHSVQRVYDLTELYHALDRGAAHALLALWRAQARPNDPASEPGQVSGTRKSAGLRDTSVASLRSRFGALTERLQEQAVNAPPGPGSAARRDLRSR